MIEDFELGDLYALPPTETPPLINNGWCWENVTLQHGYPTGVVNGVEVELLILQIVVRCELLNFG